MKTMLLYTLLATSLPAKPGPAPTPQSKVYRSPDGALRVRVIAVSEKCPENRLAILKRNGALLYRKDFSSPDCEHGSGIVRGEWSADSQFFVFNVSLSGGHQPGHRPLYFYSRRKNRLYSLENDIGYIIAADFTLKDPHIVLTEKQKFVGGDVGVPVQVDLSRVVRLKSNKTEPAIPVYRSRKREHLRR
jgi:hypothetical protein